MPKRKLTELAEENDISFDEAMRLVLNKLPEDEVTGKGKNTWIGESGQEILSNSMMIEEITPKNYKGIVKHDAPNPRFVYVHSKELKKKVPVMIPKRLSGTMSGKMITFEAIEDNSGVSYRYVRPRMHKQ